MICSCCAQLATLLVQISEPVDGLLLIVASSFVFTACSQPEMAIVMSDYTEFNVERTANELKLQLYAWFGSDVSKCLSIATLSSSLYCHVYQTCLLDATALWACMLSGLEVPADCG
jgi:hypothetical protein